MNDLDARGEIYIVQRLVQGVSGRCGSSRLAHKQPMDHVRQKNFFAGSAPDESLGEVPKDSLPLGSEVSLECNACHSVTQNNKDFIIKEMGEK
jgi:hypothetical protein